MLKQDYILRLIREFVAALRRTLEKQEVADRREDIQKLYDAYVGPYALYFNGTAEEVLRALEGYPVEERIYRIEILAELYYAEADTVGQPTRDFLLDKAGIFFELVSKQSKTFSIDREQKLQEIRRRLSK